MEFNKYTLNQPFESIGMWTPDYNNLDQAVSGILTYVDRRITLKLFGLTEHFQNKRMVYGYTEDGKLIWIPNFQQRGKSSTDSRFAVTQYPIQEFYIYEIDPQHFKRTNIIAEAFDQIFQNSRFDFQVHHLSFSTTYLLDWIGQEPYHFTEEFRNETRIPYGRVKEKNYRMQNGLSLKLELNQMPYPRRSAIHVESAAEVKLHKTSNEKFWFRKLHKEAVSFVKLMDFLGGWINQFQYLHFEIKPGIRGSYIFERRETRNNYEAESIHTTFKEIEADFEKVLLNYVHKRNKLDLVIDDYLSEFYLVEFHETKLLNSIRNLEIYHRNFIEPREAKEEDEGLEQARDQIITYINEEVPEKYQGKFRSQVYYQPEKSLRKRMDFLIKALPDNVFDAMNIKSANKRKSRSIGSFVNRIVETRHYYTHGDFPENYPHRLSEISQVKRVNLILRKICLYYVYKELGINEEVILKEIS